jgi:hypothetical protein
MELNAMAMNNEKYFNEELEWFKERLKGIPIEGRIGKAGMVGMIKFRPTNSQREQIEKAIKESCNKVFPEGVTVSFEYEL